MLLTFIIPAEICIGHPRITYVYDLCCFHVHSCNPLPPPQLRLLLLLLTPPRCFPPTFICSIHSTPGTASTSQDSGGVCSGQWEWRRDPNPYPLSSLLGRRVRTLGCSTPSFLPSFHPFLDSSFESLISAPSLAPFLLAAYAKLKSSILGCFSRHHACRRQCAQGGGLCEPNRRLLLIHLLMR